MRSPDASSIQWASSTTSRIGPLRVASRKSTTTSWTLSRRNSGSIASASGVEVTLAPNGNASSGSMGSEVGYVFGHDVGQSIAGEFGTGVDGDARSTAHQWPVHAVRHGGSVRGAGALVDRQALGSAPGGVEETGLADAGGADQLHDRVEFADGVCQHLELVLASDEACARGITTHVAREPPRPSPR